MLLSIQFCSKLRTWILTLLLCLVSGLANCQEKKEKPPTVAPPMHSVISNTIDGWNLVPKELKENFDAAMARLQSLQADVASGKLRAAQAQTELADLKKRLEILRKEIEAKRVHVKGANVHEQSETIEFELGAERRLAITCNQIRVIGWEGPKIKCVLKKIVLAPDDKPVDEHLNAIKVVHKLGRAEFAGKTKAEQDAEEKEYLAGEGAKLTEPQRAARRKFLQEIFGEREIFHDYAAKEINQITVGGLGYEENKVIPMRVESEGAGGRWGSARQRYGELTVYVPASAGVVVRGAERGLLVEKLSAPLIIVPEDSTDSDHQGTFEINGLKGDLFVRDFPLRSISHVEGKVTIYNKLEYGVEGGGTSHYDDLRDLHPPHAMPVQIDHVTGGVDLKFGRVNLNLSDIHGQLNVLNEFGDTRLVATERFDATAHRIVSQAGRIDVELSPAAWASIPVLALTNYGGVRTNIGREEFEDFHLEGQDKTDGFRRDWPGFRKAVKDREQHIMSLFGQFDRFQQILDDTARPAGLDLFSRAGNVVVIRKMPPQT